MKKLSKILVMLFVVLCIPMMISCVRNSDSNDKNEKSYTISFDLNSEYGKLNNPVLSDDIYIVDLEGINIAKIDSHGTDILGKIKENTQVHLSIYISFNSYDVEIKLNDALVEYKTTEENDYQILDFTFDVNSNINLYMNGCLEALI